VGPRDWVVVFDSLGLDRLGNQRQKSIIDRASVSHVHVLEGVEGGHDIASNDIPCCLKEVTREPVGP
jgi:hypothetical protein